MVTAQDPLLDVLFDPLFPFAGPPPMRQPMPQQGPWNNDVHVFAADAEGLVSEIALFERAGVPTMARLADGRVLAAYQYFPADDERRFDRVALRMSKDEGRTWDEPQTLEVADLPAGLARPFDPTLVPLADGRVRMYFTSNASKNPDFRHSAPAIYSAISTDGVHYTFEPGVRFAIEGRLTIDCAAALHGGTFHLYVPDNGSVEEFAESERMHRPPPGGSAYHAVSQDGLTFTRVEDVTSQEGMRWLGNAQSVDGKLYFMGTGAGRPENGRPRGGVWLGVSNDGVKWEVRETLRVMGADPGFVTTKNSGWLVVATGSARDRQPREGPNRPRRKPRPDGGQDDKR